MNKGNKILSEVSVLLIAIIVVFSTGAISANTYEIQTKKMAQSKVTCISTSAPLEDGILSEGFEEGKMPPTDWQHIAYSNNTWDIGVYGYAHSGVYGAYCHYGFEGDPQNEWLISPVLDFSSMNNIVLYFWWKSSYYWMVEEDNFDVFVKVRVNEGDWDTLWVSGDIGNFTDWTWYNTTFGAPISLDDYEGESNVQIAWHFYGEDTADFALDDILIIGIESVPILEFNEFKGGGLSNSVLLENIGHETAYNITWSMKITNGSLLSIPITLFFPMEKKGIITSLDPHEWEMIRIPMIGLGRATITFNCKYTIIPDSLRGEVDVEGFQEGNTSGLFILFNTNIPQPTITWVKIDDYQYIGSDTVDLEYGVLQLHQVRVHDSDSSDILFQASCSFDGTKGTLKECHITKDIVTSGNAYWEVELYNNQ
ncbi:MAG: hypothetical protein JSW60_08425 [Thermoplasmatales archaeon]|nr:MAG: hypothetical protein JSW60_08425 [Thermoplasmatales archaeon]